MPLLWKQTDGDNPYDGTSPSPSTLEGWQSLVYCARFESGARLLSHMFESCTFRSLPKFSSLEGLGIG